MMRPISAILALLALAAAVATHATSEHQYAKGEYAIIRGGLAPNKELSLAAHGEGGFGHDAFEVWLMAELAHRKLARLDDISAENNLDTDPDAYHAFWSQDSRHVGVAFRSSRHEVTLNLYRIENRRAYEIAGPNLFKEMISRDVGDGDGLRVRNAMVEWRGGNRFLFREYLSFVADDDKLVKLLGAYGRVAEKTSDGRFVIAFYADAECELIANDRTRVVDLKPGKPGDADNWWQQP